MSTSLFFVARRAFASQGTLTAADKEAVRAYRRAEKIRSAVHEIVKGVMRETASRLRARDPAHEAAAAHIERASTHWLRHTAGSHQSDQVDLKAVRDNLGHSNISTTSIYVHSEDDARHDATNAAHRVNWCSVAPTVTADSNSQ